MALHDSDDSRVSLDSYDTALCIIPPKHLWAPVDHLRSVYDPAYKTWPPHINLVYPFVPVHSLQEVSDLIVHRLQKARSCSPHVSFNPSMQLQTLGTFTHKKKDHAIFFRCDGNQQRTRELLRLRDFILDTLQLNQDIRGPLHMTVGHSYEANDHKNKDTVKKFNLLPPIEWTIDKLYILIRVKDKARINAGLSSQMRIWGEIDLSTLTLLTVKNPISFYEDEAEEEDETSDHAADGRPTIDSSVPLTRLPYTFSHDNSKWIQLGVNFTPRQAETAPESLAVASYNIHTEIGDPPTRDRYSIIFENLLEKEALADVLVLEEVTDDFLSQLCKDRNIRENYLFFSSGPPDQDDVEPLPAHTNVVVLNKWPFSWDAISLPSGQSGSVIVQFSTIGKQYDGIFLPVVLSAVHLTSGLTNYSIEEKKHELASVLSHISKEHRWNPWILAGDFNIPTSTYAIETAVRRENISPHSQSILFELEAMLIDAGLVDTYISSRVQRGHPPNINRKQHDINALGGEEGATVDPTVNDLAANSAPDDLQKRPQRYDRILVRGMDFAVTGFNMFGQSKGSLQASPGADTNSDGFNDDSKGQLSYGSDHWGIRCSLSCYTDVLGQVPEVGRALLPVETDPTWPIEDTSGLAACLSDQPEFPSEIDTAMRETALNLLKEVIMQDEPSHTRGLPAFVIVPIGSYGLGVWTTASDINCLCIGPTSSNIFFTLAIQRLRKAAPRGIKILRRIEVHSGTLLELEVGHIKMDLQYCSATTIAETWPRALSVPPTDTIFKLPPKVLAKLKPLRDLCHLQRTIPDLAVFKLAHRFIKCWAKRRGIYAAKFGYLGGIQISVLLSRIYKLISCHGRAISAPTLLTTFFTHYADFNWAEHTAYDTFSHKTLRYRRTAQESMSILGFYGPHLNTAQAASGPTVYVISQEFKRAQELLSHFMTTWPDFLGEDIGVVEFLITYKIFIKITAQFWSVSLAKGNSFVEWLGSKCVSLLADLSKQVPQVNPRIWPARFINQGASEEDTDYEGHYLVGLEMKNPESKSMNEEDRIADRMVALERIRAALDKFQSQVVSDPKYFNPKSCWVGTEIVPRSEVRELRLDNRDWTRYTVEAEDDDIGDSEFWASMEAEEPDEPRTKKDSTVKLPSRPAYEGKFRSAGDVLNRIRWDQGMDSSDYIIGYEDRFSGVMERPVDSWKSETTHEEFIPEHRVLFFKRKSDGTIVWDKKERRDEIFGSGVTSLRHKPKG
ncbi:uncharacterized protein F4807DRAFT_300446 [Annulohypoxylon truncatum]|uniref:uncharacterized protein n=1 Tax=Annulohypoxylon truncatum TaxID=327061 RepID=UPI002007D620|nr:uncharacterized protein F4807DRAFT_300446 [Annulohypoxylon truncatum]KAI1204918.1 hypothetical protein F4807DRAFT_300446 [Annulohypoxylon truncatum]